MGPEMYPTSYFDISSLHFINYYYIFLLNKKYLLTLTASLSINILTNTESL